MWSLSGLPRSALEGLSEERAFDLRSAYARSRLRKENGEGIEYEFV